MRFDGKYVVKSINNVSVTLDRLKKLNIEQKDNLKIQWSERYIRTTRSDMCYISVTSNGSIGRVIQFAMLP